MQKYSSCEAPVENVKDQTFFDCNDTLNLRDMQIDVKLPVKTEE